MDSTDISITIAYEKELLDWLAHKAREGVGLLKREKSFSEIQRCIDFVNGDHSTIKSKALSTIHNNRLRKVVLETVSALTDVRPIWNYETVNEQFKPQANVLNKLARAWWKNAKADRRLQSILTYACVAGAGYGYLHWDKDMGQKGDFDLIPLDPRDVVPIDPVYSDSVQDWQGVIIRQRVSVEQLKKEYPSKAYKLNPQAGNDWFGVDSGRGGKVTDYLRTALEIIRGGSAAKGEKNFGIDKMTIFLKDDSINEGDAPKVMGDPKGNWSYTVFPIGSIHPQRGPEGEPVSREEARLYPRGRMIICTANCLLDDSPNPYWHGMFPVVRFWLDPLPWSLLGASMVADLIPMQVALNETLRGMDDAIGQWVRRSVVADQGAISRENLRDIDTRRSGMKVRINATMGEGFKVLDGPQLPTFFLEYPEMLKRDIDENSGVQGLRELSQLKQMPSADTLEQYKEALSPLLKLRSRAIEISLSELAELLKSGFFQYYDARRRMQILGQDGLTLEDFDYDPTSLVPAGEGDREDRAKVHQGQFAFSIAPNSFLNISHTTQKMMIMQLFRANGIDIWSMWNSMDLVDIGPKPAEDIPGRMKWAREQGLQPGPTMELQQAQTQAAIAAAIAQTMQAQMMVQQAQQQPVGPVDSSQGGGAPQGGPPGEVSNSGVGPQGGRPPSGQQPPQMVQKQGPEGPRTTISESGG